MYDDKLFRFWEVYWKGMRNLVLALDIPSWKLRGKTRCSVLCMLFGRYAALESVVGARIFRNRLYIHIRCQEREANAILARLRSRGFNLSDDNEHYVWEPPGRMLLHQGSGSKKRRDKRAYGTALQQLCRSLEWYYGIGK